MTCAGCGTRIQPTCAHDHRRKWCSDRCRKRALYSGTCETCGGRTYSGDAVPPTRCLECANAAAHAERFWTPETVVAAIRRYADEHDGAAPSANEWLAVSKPDYAPHVSVVQRECGSWSAAIAAAGLTPRPRGRPRAA